MLNVKQSLSNVSKYVDVNSPTILTGLGVAGVIASVIFTFKAAPKVKEILDEKKKDFDSVAPGDDETKKVIVKETVVETAPYILPMIVVPGLTIACIIGSNTINTKRNAALMAAYIAADKSLTDWKKAAEEVLPKKDVEAIKQKAADNRVEEVMNNGEPPSDTGLGRYLCIDHQTGEKIITSQTAIEKAFNHLNQRLHTEFGFIPLNDLRADLGLPRREAYEDIGFNYGDTIEVRFWDGHTEDDYEMPARIFNYRLSTDMKYR